MAQMLESMLLSMDATASRVVLDALLQVHNLAWVVVALAVAGAAVFVQKSLKGTKKFTVGGVEVRVESAFTPLLEDAISDSSSTAGISHQDLSVFLDTGKGLDIGALETGGRGILDSASWGSKMFLVIEGSNNRLRDDEWSLCSSKGNSLLYDTRWDNLFECTGFPRKQDPYWFDRSNLDAYVEEDFSRKGVMKHSDLDVEEGGWKLNVPEWANSLLVPLMPVDESVEPDLYSGTTMAAHKSDEWEAVFDMYAEMDWKDIAKSILAHPRKVLSPTIVSKGPQYLARAKSEVVKLWGSSKKKILETWSLPFEQGTVCALGVGSTSAAIGTGEGYLSVWDIGTGSCLKSLKPASKLPLRSLKMNPEVGVVSAGGLDCNGSSLAVWDERAMKKHAQSQKVSRDVIGMETSGSQVYVKERLDSLRAYDLRMLGRTYLDEVALPKNTKEEKWWDAQDAELEFEVGSDEDLDEDDDDDDDDCSVSGEGSNSSSKSFLSRCISALWK